MRPAFSQCCLQPLVPTTFVTLMGFSLPFTASAAPLATLGCWQHEGTEEQGIGPH